VQHGGGLAAGAGDGRGPGIGFESFSIGEAGPVVAGLGEHLGAGERAEHREAGDDPGVWVLVKRLDGGLLEIISGGAGGVELAQQGQGLTSHRLFHERELAHLRRAQRLTQPRGFSVNGTLAVGLARK
jgi:hypothetical protein